MIIKRGFTLAEVLITLGIIGVVAAITLPTLITNYQKKQTITQLKKAYSELAQAMQKAELEHGLMQTWDFANFETAQERTTYFAENYLLPYINTLEKCIPTSNKCWADNILSLTDTIGSNLVRNTNDKCVSFISGSGYSGYFWLSSGGYDMWYYVDINGPKKRPNKIGRDIFAFSVYWGSVEGRRIGTFPAGLQYNTNHVPTKDDLINGTPDVPSLTNECLCSKEIAGKNKGVYCSGVIAIDGWQIKDDYPW